MSEFHELLAAKNAADAALLDAEASVLAELVAAKDAYREDPTSANRERKAAAIESVVALRALQRAGREAHAVGGDAFLSPEQNQG